jgi:proprotein convertase subtilisin/kexin type 5
MYLQGNTCLVECPDTHHPDPISGMCVPCDYPCLTCHGSTDTCTSCSETNPENFYFDSWCHEECPVGISVNDRGECVACDETCLTCAETWETCTSCPTEIWLDIATARCLETCPVDVSVATIVDDVAAVQSLTCAPCTENCLYCDSASTEVCQKCREGFNLWEAKRECVETCPTRTHPLYVSITDDTLCLECAEGCSECQYSSEHCQVCEPTHIFYDYQCLLSCPPGFE